MTLDILSQQRCFASSAQYTPTYQRMIKIDEAEGFKRSFSFRVILCYNIVNVRLFLFLACMQGETRII